MQVLVERWLLDSWCPIPSYPTWLDNLHIHTNINSQRPWTTSKLQETITYWTNCLDTNLILNKLMFSDALLKHTPLEAQMSDSAQYCRFKFIVSWELHSLSHGSSTSIRIACHQLRFLLYGCFIHTLNETKASCFKEERPMLANRDGYTWFDVGSFSMSF